MRAPRRGLAAPAARLALLAALAPALSGCGDDGLWARWSAERGAWRAGRAVARVELRPQAVTPREWEEAAAACREVEERFPAELWSERARSGSPFAPGVLEASGRAALLLARLDDLRGRPEAAASGYERVRVRFRAVPAISLAAAVEQARLLEREGRLGEAEGAWSGIARDYAPSDPRTGEASDAVLDAPLHEARLRRQRGDARGVDSLLRAAERFYEGLLPAERGRPAAPGMCLRLGEARWARGDVAGALAALRLALAERSAAPQAPRLALLLARRALEGASPDTALAYARWVAEGFGPELRPAGLLLMAGAWRAAGVPDSALQTYERLVQEEPEDLEAIARARYERARLLEDLGRWDQARGEYHALASLVPTHPLALESQVRAVRHHLARGERQLGLTEARHALRALDGLLAIQQDDSVRVRVGEARARLQLETGDASGCGGLAALLRRYPEAPLDAGLLARAAEVAETRLEDVDLAIELYRAAATRAGDAELRRRARLALERLGDAPR